MSTFKKIRITVLLLVLCFVAASSWLTRRRTTSWKAPLVVVVYPINGDGSDASASYIDALSDDTFDDIEVFFRDEAEQFGLALEYPVTLVVGPELVERPPSPPNERTTLAVIWWSLKMRLWAWQVSPDGGPAADIQIFVLFNDPQLNGRVPHSLGLQKGLLGVVHAFAGRRNAPGNSVVIAHELLHTVGASDKYDPQDGLPIFPDGYADPDKQPTLPQTAAEIMAGRVALTQTEARQARSLAEVVVGEQTASEIHWLD